MIVDLNGDVKQTQWWVKDLIPKGAIVGAVAKAASGKSTFAAALANAVAHAVPFLGREVEPTSVLIVDRDSDQNSFTARLVKFKKGIEGEPYSDGYIIVPEYFPPAYFSNGSLYDLINKYPFCDLVILDSFHKFSNANFKLNDIASVADVFSKMRDLCITGYNSDRTIIVLHHSTEHTGPKEITADDYMSMPDVSKLAMGSSAFIESVDCYFILASRNKGDKLTSMYLRPVSKRVLFPSTSPLAIAVVSEFDRMQLIDAGLWRAVVPSIDQNLRTCLDNADYPLTVRQIFDGMGEMYDIRDIRESLQRMAERKWVDFERKAHNQFQWYLIGKEYKEPAKVHNFRRAKSEE